ncbi:MAG TPA: peptidylprolyl isomerase [Planctomycetota bacterium]|nr:peptidylprolyl isomerase [Planctomycetota bacterium]
MARASGGVGEPRNPAEPSPGPVGVAGGRPVSAREFVAAARFLGTYEPVLEHLAERVAVVEAARREGSGATADELQAEADDWRRVLGLHRAQAMNAWLASAGYTIDEFEEEMELRVVRRKKRASFGARELEACFAEGRSDFDRVRISQIVVASEGLALELVAQVSSEKKDFHELAARHSLDETTRDVGGRLGWVRRRDLPPELAGRVFSAKPGACAAPVAIGEGEFLVVLVHESRAAELDAATEEELRDLLLERWVAKARRA